MSTRVDTLADVIFPAPAQWAESRWGRLARDAILIIGFAGFVTLCAQLVIRVPWTTVPITAQTFAVLVTGGTLGAWRGASSLTVFMLLGTAGAPVFAPPFSATSGTWDIHFILPWSGNHGLPWEITNGGYIVGFIFAAALVGYLAERQWDRKPYVHFGMLLGNVVLYIPGILWLAYLISTDWIHPVGKPLGELFAGTGTWDKALKGGLYPFIIGDLMKLYLASLLLPVAWGIVNLRRR